MFSHVLHVEKERSELELIHVHVAGITKRSSTAVNKLRKAPYLAGDNPASTVY